MIFLGNILIGLKKEYPQVANNPYLDFSLAANYAELGNEIEALAHFQNVVAHEADDVLATEMLHHTYNVLGEIYRNIEEYDKSLQAYKKAMEINPQQPYPYQNIGITYQRLKQWDEAIKYGLEAIALQSYPAAHIVLGDSYRGKGDYEKAIAQYRIAVDQAPGYKIVWIELGNSYMELHDYLPAQEA